MEDVEIAYGRLVCCTAIWYTYFVAIWYILWSFDIFFSHIGMLCLEKIWQPCYGYCFLSPVAKKWLITRG
jgi:hypothetical protein